MEMEKSILEVNETREYVKENYNKLKEEILRFFNRKSIHSQLNNIARFVLVERRPLNFKVNVEGGSYTDGENITVDVPWYMMDKSEEEILYELKANVGHEVEHINSSNFELLKKYMEEASDYLKDNFNINKNVAKHIAHDVFNSIEDGRIEKILVNRLKGYLKYIKVMRANWWKYQPVTGDDEYSDVTFAICTIATTGLYPNNWINIYTGSHAEEKVESVKDLIIDGINATTADHCFHICMKILKELGEYFADLLGKDEEKSDQLSQQNVQYEYTTSQGGSTSGQPLSNSTHFVPENDNKQSEKSNEEDSNDSKGGSSSNKSDEENSNKGSSSSDKSGEEENSTSQSKENSKNTSGESKDDKEESSSECTKGEHGSDEDEGNENLGNKDSSNDDTSSSNSDDDKNNDSLNDKNAGDDNKKIDDFMNSIADEIKDEMKKALDSAKKEEQREAKRQAEEEARKRASELTNEELDEIYEACKENNRINITFNRVEKGNNVLLPKEIKSQGKRLRKCLEEVLMNKKTETVRHRKRGIIDNNALWRMAMDDYELFKKKPNYDDSDYVFYILQDGSGSMEWKVDSKTKWSYACEASAIIEEGLKGLIPFKVVMFNSGYNESYHNIIKDFDDNSKHNQCYNAETNLSPDNGNKDGLSIRVATKELMKRNERHKVLIVLSDGKPSAYTNKEFGYADVRKAVKEARKEGIKVLSIYLEREEARKKEIEIYRKMYQQGIIACEPSKISTELIREVKKELI